MGAEVVSFEPDTGHSSIAKCVGEQHPNAKVTWNETPFEIANVGETRFDATLMLSVFQWMAKGGERLEEATNELKHISTISDTLFFELGYNAGDSCLTTEKKDHYAELIRFLNENTTYTKFELIKKTNLYTYHGICLLYTSPSPRDQRGSRMPSSA